MRKEAIMSITIVCFLVIAFVISLSISSDQKQEITELKQQIERIEQNKLYDIGFKERLFADENGDLVIAIVRDFSGYTYPVNIKIFKNRTTFSTDRLNYVLPKKEAIKLASTILLTYDVVYKKENK